MTYKLNDLLFILLNVIAQVITVNLVNDFSILDF